MNDEDETGCTMNDEDDGICAINDDEDCGVSLDENDDEGGCVVSFALVAVETDSPQAERNDKKRRQLLLVS